VFKTLLGEYYMPPQKNMYERSAGQWNPFVGCRFDCEYCKKSFQAQAKRQKRNCLKCYKYEPHNHPDRLNGSLPKTKPGQFIFTCASGDVSFCDTPFLKKIIERITSEPDKTFLIQSKNPKTFARVRFPDNVILGTTLETNRDNGYDGFAKAPRPSKRFQDFLAIEHKRKMVTCEPIMEFDLDIMTEWILRLSPEMVWIGYDSKKNQLPEPERSKVEALGKSLMDANIKVIYKKIREARTTKGDDNMARKSTLTDEQKAKIDELNKEGKPVTEIAKTLEITPSKVNSYLKPKTAKKTKGTKKIKKTKRGKKAGSIKSTKSAQSVRTDISFDELNAKLTEAREKVASLEKILIAKVASVEKIIETIRKG
jgi:predicted transcriptional regulator